MSIKTGFVFRNTVESWSLKTLTQHGGGKKHQAVSHRALKLVGQYFVEAALSSSEVSCSGLIFERVI